MSNKLPDELRQMRLCAVLCYSKIVSRPIYSIYATAPMLGKLSAAADLIDSQAALIAELQEANRNYAVQRAEDAAKLLQQSERIGGAA